MPTIKMSEVGVGTFNANDISRIESMPKFTILNRELGKNVYNTNMEGLFKCFLCVQGVTDISCCNKHSDFSDMQKKNVNE